MRKWYTAAAVAAVAFTASVASAAKDEQGDRNVFLRGGVGTFTGDLSEHTAAGPTWGLVVNVQPLNILGIELGYDGSRNALTDERLEGDANLLRSGASAVFKLAPPWVERIKPFVGVGLGATFASVQGETADLYRTDFMQEVPLTAGLEFNSGALHAGVRASYRVLVDEAFVDAAAPGVPQGDLVEGNLTLGARF